MTVSVLLVALALPPSEAPDIFAPSALRQFVETVPAPSAARPIAMRGYWPWWVMAGWAGGYELWAALTGHETLSQQCWRASDKWPPLKWIGVGVAGALILHLWVLH